MIFLRTPALLFAVAVSFAELSGFEFVLDAQSADIAQLLQKAEAGNVKAQVKLAATYEKGTDTAPEMSKAVRYWQLAESAGHQGARYKLAKALQNGNGISKDLAAARELYRIGAKSGHVSSSAKYARMLQTGEGGERDPAVSLHWYEYAADHGQTYARYRLAIALSNEPEFPNDTRRARILLEGLVEDGYSKAPYALAEFLMAARRTKAADRVKALELWYSEAMKGNTRALARMARKFPNAYVAMLQKEMKKSGEFHGRVSGKLTSHTIRAITRTCLKHRVNDICRLGPMRSASAKALSKVLFQQAQSNPSG